jgi:hypothetical protein
MYALVNGQELLLGPIAFNYRMINSVLEEELEVEYRVTSQDYQNVPLNFTEDIKILPATNDIPEFDPRFQTVSQTSHTIADDEVVFVYTVEDKTLEQIKEEYKAGVKPERQRRENTSIEVTINNSAITVSTDRENRLALIAKYIAGPGLHNFKFDNGTWLEITTEDLQTIIQAVDLKVQEAYDWELAKLQEIDACETKEAVYEVEIVPTVEIPGVVQNAQS